MNKTSNDTSELPSHGLDPNGFSEAALSDAVHYQTDEGLIKEAMMKIDIGACPHHHRVAIHTMDANGDHTYIELSHDLVGAFVNRLIEALANVGYMMGAVAAAEQFQQIKVLAESPVDASKAN
jgi:hypothetical protein